jgi:hypothetical protein
MSAGAKDQLSVFGFEMEGEAQFKQTQTWCSLGGLLLASTPA